MRIDPDVLILRSLQNALRYCTRTWRPVLLCLLVGASIAPLAYYGIWKIRFDRSYSSARASLDEYDFPAARERLAECARLRPDEPTVWLLAAQVARRDGALEDAESHLARYKQLSNGTPEGKIQEILLRVQQGRIEPSVQYLMSLADSKHPDTEQILEALAVGSIHVYQFDKAEFWIGHLLARFPKNPVGRLIRVQTDHTLGRHERAWERCRELVADFPRHNKARLTLATISLKLQKFDDAIDIYRTLLEERTEELFARLGLVRCFERTGRLSELAEVVRDLEERHADNSDSLLVCGKNAIGENRLADAERLLTRAAQLSPNDHNVHYQLGLCLEQLGKVEEAKSHMVQFKRIEADLVRMEQLLGEIVKKPQEASLRREIGMICLRNGQIDEGLRWLYGVLETAPHDRETNEALADFFHSKGDLDRSVQHRRQIR